MIRLFENAHHAQAYAFFRPKTPKAIASKTIDYMIKSYLPNQSGLYDLMIDVGCGGGQSTTVFAPYFKRIIGIDPSAEQIKQAQKSNTYSHIIYKVGKAEDLGTETNVDLVASGQAVHWMDIPAFFQQCNRILKPTGCLLMHGYDRPKVYPLFSSDERLTTVAEELFSAFYSKCLFHPRRKHVDDRYEVIFDLLTSNHKMRDDTVENAINCSLFDFVSYIKTWSGYLSYIEKHPHETDILEEFILKLKKEWGIDGDIKEVPVKLIYSNFMILSKPPVINKT